MSITIHLWGSTPPAGVKGSSMECRASMLFSLVILCAWVSSGQDSTASAPCQPFGDPMTCVLQIMRGAPYDSVKQYIDPDASVIAGRTCQRLIAILQRGDRASILGCDSARAGWVKYTSDTAGDAMCFTIQSIGIADGENHYHSVVLYKKPAVGWQISLWHVGE